jgi:hypothetical protein
MRFNRNLLVACLSINFFFFVRHVLGYTVISMPVYALAVTVFAVFVYKRLLRFTEGDKEKVYNI